MTQFTARRSPPAMLPLVISSGARALSTAAAASVHYAAAGIPSIVVRPGACASENARFAPGTRFIDDEALAGFGAVRQFLEDSRLSLAQFNRTPGWFLQQFIKLAAVATLDVPFVFVSDGDTVFSQNLLTEILQRPKIIATGEKYDNYNRLVLALNLTSPALSCVANGNIFSQAPILRELATPNGFISVLREHVLPSQGVLDFSEYQIAGAVLEPELGSRRIRLFRRFDLLLASLADVTEERIARALRRYDAVAIEADHHRSIVKRIAAHFLYAARKSW